MDTADDIAYAIHDLQDFHRIGVLQHAPVAAELGEWLEHAGELAALDDETLHAELRRPGRSLERVRRRMHGKDAWIVDDDAFAAAVARVRAELVDGLLGGGVRRLDRGRAGDGGVLGELDGAPGGRACSCWRRRPPAPVTCRCGPAQWHEVQVLKFVHRRFVLLRPDLALHQRGQAGVVSSLVDALDAWLADRDEVSRLPRRLHDLVELAHAEYTGLARTAPELLVGATGEPVSGPDAVREPGSRPGRGGLRGFADRQAGGDPVGRAVGPGGPAVVGLLRALIASAVTGFANGRRPLHGRSRCPVPVR